VIEFVQPQASFGNLNFQMLKHLESCGRTCYNSKPGDPEAFLRRIIASGHESVIEHASLTARIICSRACSHQLVRHRLGAYSQRSQRYVAERGHLFAICPPSISKDDASLQAYTEQLEAAFTGYTQLLASGCKPEDARYLLPNAAATEIVATYNLRQWRHVFKERALNPHAQWEIRGIFLGLLSTLQVELPALFGDLN